MERAAQKEQVAEKVRENLPDVPDALIAQYVDRAEEYFLARTRRQRVPARAFWLWVDTTLEIRQGELSGAGQQVSSVKRGDTTVSYQDGASGFAALDRRIDGYRVAVSR